MVTKQLPLFELPRPETPFMGEEALRLEAKYASRMREELRLGRLVTSAGNRDVPLLRLYRYKEAFAFRLVEEILERLEAGPGDYVFDPFCGSGTTLLVASQRGIPAIGLDRLPVAVFIAKTLPLFFQISPGQLKETYTQLLRIVPQVPPARVAMDMNIMQKAFPDENLERLRRWKTAIDALDSPMREVFQLLLLSILEPCSYALKDGQFLRLQRNRQVARPDEMLAHRVREAEKDLLRLKALRWKAPAPEMWHVVLGDARDLNTVPFRRPPTVIVTSPPYANRYDYTRTYSLELCFGFVQSFDELKALRHSLLRSHIEARLEPSEEPPHPAVLEVVEVLEKMRDRLNNPNIPNMLVGYFVDMRKAIREWRRVLAPGARVALVVGNVRFEGYALPVDLILSEMAEAEGFQIVEIIVARHKNNSAQQMARFGRFPARESILFWKKPA